MSVNRASTGGDAHDAPAAVKVDIAALYERYHAILAVYARGVLPPRRHEDAKDAISKVFRRLLDQRAKDTLAEPSNWEAYLKQAVRNACLDIIKVDREHSELDPEDPQIHRQAPPDPTADAIVEAISQRERQARVEAALSTLDNADSRLRIVLVGRLFDDLTNAEIGAQLNISGQRVSQLYRQALMMFEEEVNRTNDR